MNQGILTSQNEQCNLLLDVFQIHVFNPSQLKLTFDLSETPPVKSTLVSYDKVIHTHTNSSVVHKLILTPILTSHYMICQFM